MLELNHAKGVGCHTAGYYLPSAFIREYLAVMKMNTKSLVVLVFASFRIIFNLIFRFFTN